MNIHPLIVHAPIIFLVFYPITLAFSLFWKKYQKEWMWISQALLLVGFVSALLSISSGAALEDWVELISPQVLATFKRHEEFAEMTRNLAFLALLLHLVVFFVKNMQMRAVVWIQLFLGLGIATTVALTGSEGGKLTHEYHVGAIHCQEMAHPLGNLAETLMPMGDTNVLWEKKTKGEAEYLSTRARFESLCKKAIQNTGTGGHL